MIGVRVFIEPALRKLRAPKQLPVLSRGEAEARAWFQGYWIGIFVGILLGLGSATMVAIVLGLM